MYNSQVPGILPYLYSSKTLGLRGSSAPHLSLTLSLLLSLSHALSVTLSHTLSLARALPLSCLVFFLSDLLCSFFFFLF